jgi:hypothetical protein
MTGQMLMGLPQEPRRGVMPNFEDAASYQISDDDNSSVGSIRAEKQKMVERATLFMRRSRRR